MEHSENFTGAGDFAGVALVVNSSRQPRDLPPYLTNDLELIILKKSKIRLERDLKIEKVEKILIQNHG